MKIVIVNAHQFEHIYHSVMPSDRVVLNIPATHLMIYATGTLLLMSDDADIKNLENFLSNHPTVAEYRGALSQVEAA